MQGKVALEEHFAIPATLADSQVFGAHVWDELGPRLTDFQDKRLRLMDASGVDIIEFTVASPAASFTTTGTVMFPKPVSLTRKHTNEPGRASGSL